MARKRARKKAKAVGVQPGNDDVVNRYRAGVQSRAAENRKPGVMPDLAAAHKEYDPEKDGPMTMDQVRASQQGRKDVAQKEEGGALSPETVEGLQALKQQVAMDQQNQEPEQTQQEPQPELDTGEAEERDEGGPSDSRVREVLNQMDDNELDLMMNRIRQDVIQNEVERKAVKERVVPMSIEDGLVDMNYTQSVPIIPDKLTVVYRSISSMEQFEIRKILHKEVLEDPAVRGFGAEKLGLMQVVASVVQINGNRLPDHLKQNGGRQEFDSEVFAQKLNRFLMYPEPLIHSLGTHAHWFDQRVRELFAAESLKNG